MSRNMNYCIDELLRAFLRKMPLTKISVLMSEPEAQKYYPRYICNGRLHYSILSIHPSKGTYIRLPCQHRIQEKVASTHFLDSVFLTITGHKPIVQQGDAGQVEFSAYGKNKSKFSIIFERDEVCKRTHSNKESV